MTPALRCCASRVRRSCVDLGAAVLDEPGERHPAPSVIGDGFGDLGPGARGVEAPRRGRYEAPRSRRAALEAGSSSDIWWRSANLVPQTAVHRLSMSRHARITAFPFALMSKASHDHRYAPAPRRGRHRRGPVLGRRPRAGAYLRARAEYRDVDEVYATAIAMWRQGRRPTRRR